MPRYINRKNKEYFLHKGQTKTGKDKYYFSQKLSGATSGKVPDGYEVYEAPNGVFYQKIFKKTPFSKTGMN